MGGHVFLVPGDLTRLFCDAWLLPCDGMCNTRSHWHSDPRFGVPRAWVDAIACRPGLDLLEVRSHRVPVDGGPRPVPWLTNTGRFGVDVSWYVDGVRQFVARASAAIKAVPLHAPGGYSLHWKCHEFTQGPGALPQTPGFWRHGLGRAEGVDVERGVRAGARHRSGAPAFPPEPQSGVRHTVVLAIPSRDASLQSPGPFHQADRSAFRSACALGAAGTERGNSGAASELPTVIPAAREPHLFELTERSAELGVVDA